jgi:hypothetical protein
MAVIWLSPYFQKVWRAQFSHVNRPVPLAFQAIALQVSHL